MDLHNIKQADEELPSREPVGFSMSSERFFKENDIPIFIPCFSLSVLRPFLFPTFPVPTKTAP
jgi:hypothetical protein